MKAVRTLSLICLLTVCAVLFCGCGAETLAVNAVAFDTLQAKEPDTEQIRLNLNANGERYTGPLYHVYEYDDSLYLNIVPSNDAGANSCYVNRYYLLSDDLGEWGGWVAVSEYDALIQNAPQFQPVITGESCLGFLEIPYEEEGYGKIVYIVTGSWDSGKLYAFDTSSDIGWKCGVLAEFEGHPNAFLYDEGEIVIAGEDRLFSVDSTTGEITVLFTAEYLPLLSINSIAKVKNSYYIGTTLGILEYRIGSGDTVWYPYPNGNEAS